MNLFRRKYESLGYECKSNREIKEELKKFNNVGLKKKDIIALIIATFQIIMPFAISISLCYFLIILFMVKFWMN